MDAPSPLRRFISIPGFVLNLRASEFSHGLLQYHWDSWCIATEQRKRQDCIRDWWLASFPGHFLESCIPFYWRFLYFRDYKNTASIFHAGECLLFFYTVVSRHRHITFISIEWRSNESETMPYIAARSTLNWRQKSTTANCLPSCFGISHEEKLPWFLARELHQKRIFRTKVFLAKLWIVNFQPSKFHLRKGTFRFYTFGFNFFSLFIYFFFFLFSKLIMQRQAT